MHALKTPRSLAPLSLSGLILGLISASAIVAAGIGYRLGWWHFTRGLTIAEWAVYTAILAFALSLTGMWRSLSGQRSSRRGFVAGLVGAVVALPILGMAIHWEYASRIYPPINDISTDTEDPPTFWEMPNPMDYPGEKVAALQHEAYPDLYPLEPAAAPDLVFAQALAQVRERGWDVVASKPEEGTIEATASSRLFGFTDEVAIRIMPTDTGARVDVRSRSRLGRIDRGVNAKRIRAYLDDLKQRLPS